MAAATQIALISMTIMQVLMFGMSSQAAGSPESVRSSAPNCRREALAMIFSPKMAVSGMKITLTITPARAKPCRIFRIRSMTEALRVSFVFSMEGFSLYSLNY